MIKGEKEKDKKQNILAQKLHEISDIPFVQNLAIFGKGTILGEEDLFHKRSKHPCTLSCVSMKGTLF